MSESERRQTTKGASLTPLSQSQSRRADQPRLSAGIWMSKGQDMPVLVMDVEGTDGRERGEDQVRSLSLPRRPLLSAPA